MILQIEEGVDCAQHGNSNFTNSQTLVAAYAMISLVEMVKDVFRERRRLQAIDKTWPNFKTSFFQAHVD